MAMTIQVKSGRKGLLRRQRKIGGILDSNVRAAGYQSGVTAETVSQLCQQGRLNESVEALGVLVQTDCGIAQSLFRALIKRCEIQRELVVGRRVHALLVREGYESDTFLCNHIMRMYAVHARLAETMDVFTMAAKPDVFMWSSVISANVRHGKAEQAIQLYQRMLRSGVKPDGHVFVAALQACARRADLKTGQQVHADVLASGGDHSLFVYNSLVDMYGKCGSLEDAQKLFDGLAQKDVVTWNAMIAGYSQQGMGWEALRLYRAMQQDVTLTPTSVTFLCLLQACASVGSPALAAGKQLHANISEGGHEADVFVANSLVNMYAKCGSLEDAQRVFDGLANKNVVTWTALLGGYSQQGIAQEALRLYSAMQKEGTAVPDTVTLASLLQACASVGGPALEMGRQLHAEIGEQGLETDLVLGCSLVNMYAKCGSLDDAQVVFARLGQKNVVTWTALIAGYSQQGMGQEALQLYSMMQEEGMAAPDSVTFVCLLQACASTGISALEKGRQLHAQIREQGHQADVFVANSLVDMYAKCGSLEDAQLVFDGLGCKDVVTWTALIAGYSQQGMGQEALRLHSAMQAEGMAVPDSLTFASLLQACASVGSPALVEGKQLHAEIGKQGLEADAVLGCSLVNMYAKCGSLEDAQIVFDKLGQKNVVTWTALITGYSQQGVSQEALRLYGTMQDEGMFPLDSVTFVCLLQAFASMGAVALEKGKQLHAQIRERGLEAHVSVANSLVSMYAKCGSLQDAQGIFDGLDQKLVMTWNAMIAGYSQQNMGQEALGLYSTMEEEGIAVPDALTFASLLQACASLGALALDKGRQIHEQIKQRGFQAETLVSSSLVKMYSKCGSLEDARVVFDELGEKSVVTWNSMIAGYSQQGMGQEALHLYRAMQAEGTITLNSGTFVSALQACASVGTPALQMGQQIHAEIGKRGLQADLFVANNLVNMYAKCGALENAQALFDGLGEKNVVTWNALIAGYCQKGMLPEGLSLLTAMKQDGTAGPNSVTFVSLLQACASAGTPALEKGKQLHAETRRRGLQADLFVANSLVNMYAKCGSLEAARGVFDGLGEKNVVTWNAIIAGYSQHGMGQEALSLYMSMQEEGILTPDCVTFVCLLHACASLGTAALETGKQLHVQIRQQGLQGDLFVASSLVNMYAKCNSLDDAQTVFDGLSEKNVVTWNAMIAGYSQQGMGQEALELYRVMQEDGVVPLDTVTFVCLLQACASVGASALESGKQLHAQIGERGLQADVFVANSLVNMYAKCGSLQDARGLFDELRERTVVTWNAMISGYSQQGMGQEALGLYRAMQEEGIIAADTVTFVCLLQACANMAALHVGRQLHAQIKDQGLQTDVLISGSLINMYGKSGSMVDAQHVFEAMPERDNVAWNALISGYARQGESKLVFDLFHRMREDYIQPAGITFLRLLTVCSHTGLVHDGQEYFEAMSRQYGITPTVEHYTCMVDLLGRAGQLEEALALVWTMPVPPNAEVWHTLLGACRKWSNVEVGRHAFDEAVKLDPKDAAVYVLMSSIYTDAHMWEQAQEMQARRMRSGAWKQPGQSWWTDMDGLVHGFLVGDTNHPESKGIYARLGELFLEMKKEAYVPLLDPSSLADISPNIKEEHSYEAVHFPKLDPETASEAEASVNVG